MSKSTTPLQERKVFKALMELGQKMANQRHISAISKGMMSSMPLLLIGSIFQILASLPIEFLQANKAQLMLPYDMTMGMFSIVVVYAIAYRLAGHYKMKAMMNGAVAMIVFLMVCAPASGGQMSTTYLGGQGLFVAMIVAVVCVEVTRFCQVRKIVIKMPDAVPSSLADSFTALIPMLLNVLIFQGCNWILGATAEMSLPQAIMALLAAPLGAIETVPGMVFACLIALVLWCFGIHGTIIIYPLIMPMRIMAAETNAALIAQGEAPIFFASMLFSAIAMSGGTGNTLGMVLLGLRSKSEQLKAVSKAALVPGIFNINEPVSFGFPIVFNPILMIPYIISGIGGVLFLYLGYATNILVPEYIASSGVLLMGLSPFLKSLSLINGLWPFLYVPISMLIFYPFFKVYEAQLVSQEAALKNEN